MAIERVFNSAEWIELQKQLQWFNVLHFITAKNALIF